MTMPPDAASFYCHSGKVPPVSGIMGLLTAIGVGVIGGAIYGLVSFSIIFIPSAKLTILLLFLLLIGFGFLLGFVPTFALKRFKARSVPAAMGSAFVAFAVGYYTAWVFWTFAYLKYCHVDESLMRLTRPDVLYLYISQFNERGVWSAVGTEPTKGFFLAILWIMEAASIVGIALAIARRQMLVMVFCEHCMAWGTKRYLMQIRNDVVPALGAAPPSGKVACLSSALPRQLTDTAWCDVSIEGCGTCDNLQALNVRETRVIADKKGKKTTKHTDLVKRLLLTPEQTVTLAMTAAANTAQANVEDASSAPEAAPNTTPAAAARSISEIAPDPTPPTDPT